jgi:surface polysaccharide O-acyltransferase-like enzyme
LTLALAALSLVMTDSAGPEDGRHTKPLLDHASVPRLLWPDLLRAIAIYWVIVIHIAAVPLKQFGTISREWWWWACIYDGSARAAVPLFVMLSGALLLTRAHENLGVFVRRISKVGIPLIAWTFLYTGWRVFLHSDAFDLKTVLRHLLNGLSDPVYPHLWFLYLILGLYILVPILSVFLNNASRQIQLYFYVLWIFSTVIQPLAERSIPIGLNLSPVTGYVGYFVLGASIYKFLPGRLPKYAVALCAALFLTGFSITVFATYLATKQNGGVVDEFFLDPLAPNVIAMSVTAYLLIRHFGTMKKFRFSVWLASIAALVYGIYLVHPLIIDIVDLLGLHLDPIPSNPAWYVIFLSLLVFFLSLMATALMRQTRALSWLVP